MNQSIVNKKKRKKKDNPQIKGIIIIPEDDIQNNKVREQILANIRRRKNERLNPCIYIYTIEQKQTTVNMLNRYLNSN